MDSRSVAAALDIDLVRRAATPTPAVLALLVASCDFERAETQLNELQAQLSSTAVPDEALVVRRDQLRASLAVELGDAVLAGGDTGDAVGAIAAIDQALSALRGIAPALDSPRVEAARSATSDAALNGLVEWHAAVESRRRELSHATDEADGALMSALVGHEQSADTLQQLLVAAIARVTDELRFASAPPPDDARQMARELHGELVSLRARIANAVSCVGRAEQWQREWPMGQRLVAPPDFAQLSTLCKQEHDLLEDCEDAQLALKKALRRRVSEPQLDELRGELQRAKRRWLQHVRAQETLMLALAQAAATDFPELRWRFAALGLDDVLVAGGATAVRKLAMYEEQSKIVGGRHVVLRAKLDGQERVLKQFDIADHVDRRCFLKEAKRLRKLAHPNVVELLAGKQ